MLTVHDVAAHFLNLSVSGLDHMKLQKLCYLAQAYHLGMYGERLFDDQFRAFRWGPVANDLWRQHRYTQGLIRPDGKGAELTDDQRALIETVFARYGCYSGVALSRLTHRDWPYQDAWARANAGKGDVVDDKAVLELYSGRLTTLDISEAPPLPDYDDLRALARENGELRDQTWAGYKESQSRDSA